MIRRSIVMTLIQSGDTEWSTSGRFQGSADLPLSATGRAAAMSEASNLRGAGAHLVHHPADEAATVTAELCAAVVGARTKAVQELADPHMGLLEGITEAEFAERFPTRHRQWEDDPLSLAPPEGEEMVHAADRMFQATAKILRRARGEEVALVLHPLNLGLLRCWLGGRPLHMFREMLRERPRVERYVLAVDHVPLLAEAAGAISPSAP